MAVLALAAIGSWIGGLSGAGAIVGGLTGAALGTIVGGTVGSVIDSQFLFPAIFKQPGQNGPRLDDLRVQLASEGSPMNFCLGPENRISGVVIWMTDLNEHKTKKKVGKGGGSSSTTYTYTLSCAIGVCEGEISDIRKIWADDKLIYDADNGGKDNRSASITIYKGTTTQAADPVIQAHEGSGNTPAFRQLAYVVIEDLQLTDFGNRMPQFSFVVQAQSALSVRDAINAICARSGLTGDQYNTDQVTGCLRGYTWAGPVAGANALTPILNAFSVRVQEVDGELVFFERGSEEITAAVEADLAATDSGGLMDQLKITDADGMGLPGSVVVNFLDSENDYQKGSMSAQRSFPVARSTATIDIPFVMRGRDANQLAQRTLWQMWDERQSAEFSLPQSYLQLAEGDVLTVPFKGNDYSIRILEIDRGANFLLQVKGVVQDQDTVNITGVQDSVPPQNPILFVDSPIAVVAVDLPALRSEDTDSPGVYVMCSNRLRGVAWRGVGVFSSTLADGTFDLQASVGGEGSVGYALTKLTDGGTTSWDNVSTVEVQIFDGELESATTDEVLSGSNFILIGGEILAFTTAELLGTGHYKLSGLLRGRRDTEEFTTTHVSGEVVALLSADSMARHNLNSSALGSIRYYKAVPPGSDLDSATAQAAFVEGANLIPFSPANVEPVLRTGGDITIRWKRRTRDVRNLFAGVPNIDLASYEVELWKDGSSFRTLTCTDDTCEVTWTAAMQATDSVDVTTDTVTVLVYQRSAAVGRGKPGLGSIASPIARYEA